MASSTTPLLWIPHVNAVAEGLELAADASRVFEPCMAAVVDLVQLSTAAHTSSQHRGGEGGGDDDNDGSFVNAACACEWARQVLDLAAAMKPLLLGQGQGQGRSNANERLACALIMQMVLASAPLALDVATLAMDMDMDMEEDDAFTDCRQRAGVAQEAWHDTVCTVLQQDLLDGDDDEDDVTGQLCNVLSGMRCLHVQTEVCLAARLAAAVPAAAGTAIVTQLLDPGSMSGSCVMAMACTVAELAPQIDHAPSIGAMRLRVMTLRTVHDLVEQVQLPPPDWLARAIQASAALARRAAPQLHPTVAATLQPGAECCACSAPLDAFNLQVLRCWRPPPGGALHCVCAGCWMAWQLTCATQTQAPTCPVCRRSEGAIHAEDVEEWLTGGGGDQGEGAEEE